MFHLIPDNELNFTVMLLKFDVGGATAVRKSISPRIQFSRVLKGKVIAKIDGIEHELHEGDMVYYNLNVEHFWRNAGDDVAEVMAMGPCQFTLIEQNREKVNWRLHLKEEKRRQSRSNRNGDKPAPPQ